MRRIRQSHRGQLVVGQPTLPGFLTLVVEALAVAAERAAAERAVTRAARVSAACMALAEQAVEAV